MTLRVRELTLIFDRFWKRRSALLPERWGAGGTPDHNATSSAAVPGDTAETKAERDPEAAASSNSEGEGAQRKGARLWAGGPEP